ncbi:MAG: substrate-binding domain-containing protein [Oscillospiraceae bacterium]
MKRITALLLSFALLLLLCACGASTASGGNASSGDAYASWGDASAGDAYSSSGNAAGVLPLSATPASSDEPFFCVTLESSRLYAFPAGGGEGKLLVDKYANCFDQDGDSVLASFDDGSVARVDIRTGEVEEILPAGTQLFHRIHAYSGGFVGEYYSIRESKLYLCENGKEPVEIFPGEYVGDVRVIDNVLLGSSYSGESYCITGYALPSLREIWSVKLDPYCYPSYTTGDYFLSDSYSNAKMRVDSTDGSIHGADGNFAVNDTVLYAYGDAYLVEGNYETNFALNLVRGNERLTLDLPQAETTRYVASARDGKVLISCSASVEAGDYGWTTTTTYIVLDMESAKLYIVDLNGLYSELFADGDFPVMDSSTARKPLVQNIYRFFCLDTGYGGAEPLCSTTHGAWLNIADRKADIALLAAPTDEEKAYLAERGVEVEMKLYGGDGLVFIGNSACGVTDLTLDEVRAIFRGEITNWSELGGADHAIHVLYRDDQSGSQRLFEKMLFKDGDVPDYEALGFNRLDEMSTLVSACLDDPYAIGYSIMTYLNDVYSNEALLAFSLNGYSATPENVRTGDYPLGTKGYVVIRSDELEDSPARRLYNWFGSPLSDTFLSSCGITPLSE